MDKKMSKKKAETTHENNTVSQLEAQQRGVLLSDSSALKRQLMRRMAFAAVIGVVLLVCVVFYEASGERKPDALVPPFTLTTPVTAPTPLMSSDATNNAAPGSIPAPPPSALSGAASEKSSEPTPTAASTNIPSTEAALPLPKAPLNQRPVDAYALQTGLFAGPEEAETVRKKLTESGIPVRIESRVQAGPFASRAEADQARAKLKALGLDTAILVPKATKPKKAAVKPQKVQKVQKSPASAKKTKTNAAKSGKSKPAPTKSNKAVK